MPKTILISGSNRGIGQSIAKQLLADGYQLSLGVRDLYQSKESSFDCSQVLYHRYDALDPTSALAWVNATVKQWGGIDGLIHCAGILRSTPLLFADGEELDLNTLWNVNLMGPWWLTRAAWKPLCSSGQGRIQVFVSMSGKRVKGRMTGYSVSKFALMALCQSMRNEGWERGIRVTALCPSWVNTDMANGQSHISRDAMTQPDDLAMLSSNLLTLPNTAVPFELALNCSLEI
ncbi:SDR family NAD(P)-dependent oxidoreductase [Synechococcus sp. M16CYN]|uniref:SDR family NAD(P)-dependent oxidoreductase n=1 Tax=Synechococcus sp. M16CYN TaxID=3103139 RepID=UPI00333EE6A7